MAKERGGQNCPHESCTPKNTLTKSSFLFLNQEILSGESTQVKRSPATAPCSAISLPGEARPPLPRAPEVMLEQQGTALTDYWHVIRTDQSKALRKERAASLTLEQQVQEDIDISERSANFQSFLSPGMSPCWDFCELLQEKV